MCVSIGWWIHREAVFEVCLVLIWPYSLRSLGVILINLLLSCQALPRYIVFLLPYNHQIKIVEEEKHHPSPAAVPMAEHLLCRWQY